MAESQTMEAGTDRPNKVRIEDAGPSRKKLHIEIPAETVTEQLGSSLDTLSVEAEIPGFRRGRAPRRLIEKKFGTAVRKEAKNQLVASAFSRAVEDNKLRVVGDPISEGLDKIELEEGKALAFEVEVEVVPDFELPTLEGVEVQKPMLEVTDEMVDAELKKLAIHEGDLESREVPEAGDYLTGHGKMTGGDGTVFLDLNDAVIQVPTADKEGKGMILGIKVDDFAQQLGLPKAGEKATIKTTGPDNHENEAVRGADLTIEFTVARVDRIIPASAEKLQSQYGFESEAALRDALKSRMQQRVMIEQQNAMRNQVARYLIETTQMSLPERLTAGQAARTLARRRMELLHMGVEPQKIEENIADLRAASGEVANRELKLFFILDRAAEQLNVKVTEGEINSRIVQMALANNQRPEKLRQEIIQRNQVGNVFQQIREHKTMDAIIAKAKVTEVDAEEFQKGVDERAAAESASKTENGGEGGEKPAKKKTAKKTAKKTDAE